MRLEDAIFLTAHEFGIEVLAAKWNASRNTVQHKANPNDAAHYFRPRELVDLQTFAQDYRIAHAMAGELGGQFIAPANFAHLSDEALLDLFTGLMGQVGDFSKDFRDAWSDGRITPREFGAIRDDLYRVKQVCAEIEARMATLVETRPKAAVGANVERIRPGAK